jgi:polar amino acid transport system substrate-binding protein
MRREKPVNARTKITLAAAAVAALAMTGCGSNSLSGEPAGSSAPSASVSQNAGLADQLPDKIKSSGTIVIGTDASYAPNEFLAGDGKTVQGMDVDLFNAVAAKLGVKTQWQPADFSSIITGVQGKKYDVGVSSFTIDASRKKQVTMVSYFSAGTQWATAKGNPKGVSIDNACGKNIAVQTGTVQEGTDLPQRQKECEPGNKIKILSYKGQDQATAAVVSGKADAMLADSPVAAYAVKQAGGKLETLGDVYEAAPYGYVLPKDETEFGTAIASALKELNTDGTYKQILTKWGVEAGAITDFAVNP